VNAFQTISLSFLIVGYHCIDVGIVKRPSVSISEVFASDSETSCTRLYQSSCHTNIVESSRVQSDSRVTWGAHRPPRVQWSPPAFQGVFSTLWTMGK